MISKKGKQAIRLQNNERKSDNDTKHEEPKVHKPDDLLKDWENPRYNPLFAKFHGRKL